MVGATAGLVAAGRALDHLNANTVVAVMAPLQVASAGLFINGCLPSRAHDRQNFPSPPASERKQKPNQHPLES